MTQEIETQSREKQLDQAQKLCDNFNIPTDMVLGFGTAMTVVMLVEDEMLLAVGALALTLALGVSGMMTAKSSIKKMHPDITDDEVFEMQTKHRDTGDGLVCAFLGAALYLGVAAGMGTFDEGHEPPPAEPVPAATAQTQVPVTVPQRIQP